MSDKTRADVGGDYTPHQNINYLEKLEPCDDGGNKYYVEYLHCWKDDNGNRAFESSSTWESDFEACNNKAIAEGKKFFAYQATNECYVGDQYNKHGAAPDDECDRPCKFKGYENLSCGGNYRNSVYKAVSKGYILINDKNTYCSNKLGYSDLTL